MTVRLSLLPPPPTEELRALRVHEIVRDYPELRFTLQDLGVNAGGAGGRVLGDVLASDGPALRKMLDELRWRVDPAALAASSPSNSLTGKGGDS